MKISQLLSQYYGDEFPCSVDESSNSSIIESETFKPEESVFSRIRQVRKKIDILEDELYLARHALFTEMLNAQYQLNSVVAWKSQPIETGSSDYYQQVPRLRSLLSRLDQVKDASTLRNFKHKVMTEGYLRKEDYDTFIKYMKITKDQEFSLTVKINTENRLDRLLSQGQNVDLDHVREMVQISLKLSDESQSKIRQAVIEWTKQRCLQVLEECSPPTVADFAEWINEEIVACVDFLSDCLEDMHTIHNFINDMQLQGFRVISVLDSSLQYLTTLSADTRAQGLSIALSEVTRQRIGKIQFPKTIDFSHVSVLEKEALDVLVNVLMDNEASIKTHLTLTECPMILYSLTTQVTAQLAKECQTTDSLLQQVFWLRLQKTLTGTVSKQLLSILASFFGSTLPGNSYDLTEGIAPSAELRANVTNAGKARFVQVWTTIYGASPHQTIMDEFFIYS